MDAETRGAQRRVSPPLILAIVGGLLLLPWIGRVPLLDSDEPRFAECSRQMLVTGNWLYPQFNGIPRHAKPAFFNWVQLGAYSLLGVNEFAARLPSVLATVGTGLLLYWFARRWRGERVAILAMATWFALPQTHLWGKMSVVDPLLTLLTAAALTTAFVGMETERGGWRWYVVSGFAMGLAMLTKGPVGIVIPAAVYLFYALGARSLRKGFGRASPYLALLIAAAVAGPWFALQIMHYGPNYVHEFWGYHNVHRYASARTIHPLGQPWAILVRLLLSLPVSVLLPNVLLARLVRWVWPIPTVLVFAFPVSVLLPRALLEPLRSRRAAWAGEADVRWRLFLAVWVVTDAVLLAPSGTILPQYLLALYPPAALLIADLLAREAFVGEAAARRSAWTIGALLAFGLLLGAGASYAAWQAPALAPKGNLDNAPLMAGIAWTLAGVVACAGLMTAVAWARARGLRLVVPVLGMALAVGVLIADVVWPAYGITRDQGLKELGLVCRDALPADAELIDYRLMTSTAVFYSRHTVVWTPRGDRQEAQRKLAEHPRAYVLTHRRSMPELYSRGLRVKAAARQYVLLEPATTAPAASTAATLPPPPR